MRAIVFLLLLATGALRAQPLPAPEEGPPLFQRFYGWEDYGLHSQNWAAVQDPRGVLFVANTNGILEYDGQAWRTHELPDGSQSTIRSLAVGGDGQVYAGGVGEVGVLRPDSLGRLRYASLLPHLAADARDFADVWTTHATPDGVYFQTFDRLMRWDGRRMRVWRTDARFHKAFESGGVLYVREEGVGLRHVVADRLETVPGGRLFAEEPVFAVLPHPRGLLVASKTQGLFLLMRGRATPLTGTASAYLQTNQPYNGLVLPNPYGRGHLYALATLGGGVLVADEAGRAVRVYGADVGLGPDDLVLHVARDVHGGFWLALNNGIRRFDALSTLTKFERSSGLLGSVYDVQRSRGVVYAATSSGLFRLRAGSLGLGAESAYAGFEPVPGVPGQCWAFLEDEAGLLAATNEGVFAVDAAGAVRLIRPGKAFSLFRSERRPGRIYVGTKDGLAVLERDGGSWVDRGQVAGVSEEVRAIDEDADGTLWAAPVTGGLLLIRPDPADVAGGQVRRFEAREAGLPSGPIGMVRVGDEITLLNSDGVFHLAREGGRMAFRRVEALRSVSGYYTLLPDPQGRLWVSDGEALRVLQVDGDRTRDVTPAGLQLRGLRAKTIFQDADGVVWLGTEDGLVRYDPRVRRVAPHYPTLVRRVSSRSGELLFGGAFGWARGALSARQGDAERLDLPYRLHDLRFELAAAAFNRPEDTRFQVRLEGFDEAWGPWLKEPVAEFTNLPERRAYRLHVRARDAQGYVGAEAVYTFRVRPPWYRSWWAYALYVLVLTAVVGAVTRWRIQTHRAAADHERMLNLRLDRMNRRLERTTSRLREANQMKDELLANASHELRTPLTAILGFSEILEAEVEDPDHRDLSRSIHRSGKRLYATIHDLLDHARLRTGQLRLNPAPTDVAAVVRAAVAEVRADARAKGLVLRVEGADAPVPALLDASALARVLGHVLGNAVKFTLTGEVAVELLATRHEVDVVVRDTGIGIAPAFLPRLFDDFKQASTGYGRTHEGSGLGLAIVRRFVRLMGGEVEAESALERGTTITLRLPLDTRRPFTSGDGAPAPPPLDPALEGIRALGIGLPGSLRAALARGLGAEASLTCVDDLDGAAEQARLAAYDVVLVGDEASALPGGIAPAALLRALPGYDRVPFVALAAGPAPPDALGCDVALPPDPATLLPALADLLGQEEYLNARSAAD